MLCLGPQHIDKNICWVEICRDLFKLTISNLIRLSRKSINLQENKLAWWDQVVYLCYFKHFALMITLSQCLDFPETVIPVRTDNK